jgi:hypothetical protein
VAGALEDPGFDDSAPVIEDAGATLVLLSVRVGESAGLGAADCASADEVRSSHATLRARTHLHSFIAIAPPVRRDTRGGES